jgi:hypothetical protein
MIVKSGESRQDTLRSGTYDGITFIANIQAAAADTALAASDFKPGSVSVKTLLKRNNKTHVVFQDTLLLLGTFNSVLKGYHEFVNGIDKVYKASGVKAVKLRPVTLKFGSPLRINPGDELFIEVTPAQSGTWGANADAGASYIEFYANPCVGYEVGVPSTVAEVIQANASKQSFNPGNGITDIAILNFDKDKLDSEVVSNLQLASDRLDLNLTFNQLLAHHLQQYDNMPAWRTGTTLPTTLAGQDVFRGLDFIPQTYVLTKNIELAQVRLDISFNSANVASSQNYIVYRQIVTDKKTIVESIERQQKHVKENFNALPQTV